MIFRRCFVKISEASVKYSKNVSSIIQHIICYFHQHSTLSLDPYSVGRRQILTFKVDRRTVRVKIVLMAIDP